jgi:hypothetical protein
MDLLNPLTDEHLTKINQHLAALNAADIQITMAEQAGFTLPGRRDEVAKARAQLTAIKQVYFPGR